MKLFSLLFTACAIAYTAAVCLDQEPVDPSKVDRVVVVHPGESIQSAVDSLAGFSQRGGTVQLDAGATYRDVAVVLPWTSPRYYNAIRIRGDRTRLVSPKDSQQPVLWVGRGWDDWQGEKFEGIELSGLIIEQTSEANPGLGKGVYIAFTKGAVIRDCEFVDCPFEALYEEGGTANEQLTVLNCRAFRCGKKYAIGPLAAYNLNGWGSRLVSSTASYCGWGVESGGTEFRLLDCHFSDSPCALGSTVYGCSNQLLSRNTFERSSITVGNGIGRMSDVQILDNTLIGSGINWNGAATTNRVQLPGLPWFDHTSIISGNSFTKGDGVRLTAWDANVPSMPLRVSGNRFECDSRRGVIVQGRLANPVDLVDNFFSDPVVGAAWLYLPGGAKLPDPTPQLRFARNRTPDGAYLLVNDGGKEWRVFFEED